MLNDAMEDLNRKVLGTDTGYSCRERSRKRIGQYVHASGVKTGVKPIGGCAGLYEVYRQKG